MTSDRELLRPALVGNAATVSDDEAAIASAEPAPHRSRVARNTAAGTVGKIATMVLGFAVTPVLLAKLGTTEFGLYAILISLQSYYGLLDLGIGSGLSRFMITHAAVGDEVGVRRITSFGIIYYVALALLLFPLVHVLGPTIVAWLNVSPQLSGQATTAIYFLFGLFMASSAAGVVGARLYAINRMDLNTLAGVMSNACFVLAILLVVPRYPTLLAALACSAVPVVTGVAINIWMLRRLGVRSLLANPFRLSGPALRSLFSFGAWSQVNNLTAVINLEADKLVIGRLLGTATVTPYQVGNRYALLSRALPLTLLGALYPDVTARLARGLGGAEFATFYRNALRALMVSTLTIVGFLVAVAPSFIAAWIGHAPPGSTAIAIALLLSYAVNNLTGVGTTVVRAEGHPEIETCYAIAAAVLNIGTTILLVPHFGLWGVVGGTIIGNVLGSIGFMLLFHARARLPFGSSVLSWLVPLLLGVAAASAVTYGLTMAVTRLALPGGRWTQLAFVIATGPVYLGLLVAALVPLGFWSDQERALVQRLRARLPSMRRRFGVL